MATMDELVGVVHRLMETAAMVGDIGTDDGGGYGDDASETGLPSLWNALPKLVVVGGQSSGKSSVLEAVVGRDFLPRGKGIVTKRPLVLSLRSSLGEHGSEYGVFQHLPTQQFTDFDAVRQEIENETIRHLNDMAAKMGRHVDVSHVPICLTIHSPRVPNLTLVDLPGLVQHAMHDQRSNIVQELQEMVLDYIRDENAIILAVIPAPDDLANSAALRVAKRVDPQLARTIGVVTKIDLMDTGTDAGELLANRAYPLTLGWVGVVNRSQRDIETNRSMTEARAKEEAYFKSHAAYRNLDNVGTGYLCSKLSALLTTTIKRKLPHIQASLRQGVKQLQQRLEEMGGRDIDSSRGGMLHTALEVCKQVQDEFKTTLERGSGGERVVSVFQLDFPKDINAQPFNELLSMDAVKQVVHDSDGYQPHLVAPEKGYRTIIERGVRLLEGPAVRAVESVHVMLCETLNNVADGERINLLQRYAGLRTAVLAAALSSLEEYRDKALDMVVAMVRMEACYIVADSFRQATAGGDGENGAGTSPNEYQRIAAAIKKYLRAVVHHMQHSIPKAIVYLQIKTAEQALLTRLQRDAAKMDDNHLRHLLGEDEVVTSQRDDVIIRLDLLEKATAELAKVA